ncbi:ATP-binding protein [Methylobacterium durans]|uniref:histidine kinase n=1 Tax=Methylobacterium durans TaxID=2202825 RepID=A0A2U8WAW6_9HYPH|nr:ATP-binding protein [Methylobacterium durans]AWN43293.1 hybrid sensor histidine kinase/response regulator [Methylobacterium durans]
MRRGLVLLALAALLPLILLAAGLSFFFLRQQQAAMRTEAVHYVEQMLGSVERELFTQIELLRVLAQSPLLDGEQPNLAAFHDLATRFQGQLPLWHRIILADTEGRQIVKTGVPFGAPLSFVVDEKSYRRLIETGEPTIGDISGPGQPSSGPRRASFRVPVLREGKLRFALTGVVSTEGLSRLLAPAGLDPNWRPFLVDNSDQIAAHLRTPELVGRVATQPAIQARATGTSGVYEGLSPAGEPIMTAFRKSDRTGWSAHVAIPLALYNQPLTRALWIVSIAGFAALCLTVVFALLLRREMQDMREETLLHERAVRMEALGRMTGGVAHDFNNLLMVILGNLEMLQRRIQEPRLERYITAIRKAAERGTHLTRELLAFSRGQAMQAEVLDLNERLTSTLAMIKQSVRGDIVVETDLAPGQHVVKVDPLQLDLALLNIAANARDAMPEGGRLRLETRRAAIPDRSGREGVKLSISDTGGGIPAEALPHVFEPFFTTKEVGKGTGLGLSQVYGFAKASAGLADIESRAGRGTTVALYLPLSQESVPAPTHQTQQSTAAGTRAGRIRVLLVDDNDEVRAVTAAYLEEAGFHVSQANGARAGLDLLESSTDLLVSDLVMPGGMDGLVLAKEARRLWPKLPVILVSGYSTSASAAAELGFTLFMKPFDMSALAASIRSKVEQPERSNRSASA